MWYSKFDLKKREGGIICPNCNSKQEEQIYYSLDEIYCNECISPILFIRTKSFIYTFDLGNSPLLFIKMYEVLKSLPMKEAYIQLLEVSEVFCDERQ